jgi:DNA-binding transcriptional LysR family regulator
LKELRLEFGLVFNPPSIPGIKIEHLATAELVALTNKLLKLNTGSKMTLEDLAGLPLVNLNSRSPLGQILATHIENSGIEFHSVASVETYQMAKALVSHGAGVALIDEFTARSAGHLNVVASPLNPPMQFTVFSIVTQQFIAHLKNETRAFLEAPLN